MKSLPATTYGVGQRAEQAAARLLIQRGWMVIPISEYTNNTGGIINAPMLMMPNGMKISPDLFAIRNGKQIWCEVKDKTAPTYTWKWHRWEHGIDLPNCNDYQAVQDQSGFPVYLLVHENNSPKTPDLHLESMSDISAYKKMKADLKPSSVWLVISLDEALLSGNILEKNPEMISANNPRGAGLYWPRSAMKIWESFYAGRQERALP